MSRFLTAPFAAAILCLLLVCLSYTTASAQTAPSVVGSWVFEFDFNGADSLHKVQFDAGGDGKGTFLLLDTTSSLNPPPTPKAASWFTSQQGNHVHVTCEIEFPVGNVGINPGELTFHGDFSGTDMIIGTVTFQSKAAGAPPKTGPFVGRRGTSSPPPPSTSSPPSVSLLSLND